MPICPDDEVIDETSRSNPFLIDLFVLNKTTSLGSRERVIFKLKPIHVLFEVFEHSFFKKRRGIYTRIDLLFLESLLNKLKPTLIRLLHKTPIMSSSTSIALSRDIFDIQLCYSDTMKIALTHTEFISMLDTADDTYVRTTVHLPINAIQVDLTLEFIFKVQGITCVVNHFDADDLCLNPIF
jgi:hypothetical protein